MNQQHTASNPLHTFSISGRCARTGELGIAVSTAAMCVGALVPYVRTGAGAVATQAFVNPYLGIRGLEYLAGGMRAQEVVDKLVAGDAGIADRQVAVIDASGGSAAFSGEDCVEWFGHRVDEDVAVAGNMLTGPETLDAMLEAWRAGDESHLGERLLAALEAGLAAGGDKRGHRSAALRVVGEEEYAAMDIRIDDADEPVAALRTLFSTAQEKLFPIIGRLPSRRNPIGSPRG
jgi:uncharacterized Ntn-hydrolase superfamily protein